MELTREFDPRSETSGPFGVLLSISRAVIGFLFACHGAASLFGVFGGAHGTDGGTVELGVWPSWWAAAIQLVGGGLVALGLLARPAALLCSGSMAYAYFVVHQPQALMPMNNGGETAALYAWAFLLIAVAGPGPGSLRLGRLRCTAASACGSRSGCSWSAPPG